MRAATRKKTAGRKVELAIRKARRQEHREKLEEHRGKLFAKVCTRDVIDLALEFNRIKHAGWYEPHVGDTRRDRRIVDCMHRQAMKALKWGDGRMKRLPRGRLVYV